MMENHPTIASNHSKSACLACSNKWCHSLRDSGSEQNVMGARWVVAYDLGNQEKPQFTFYQPCRVLRETVSSTENPQHVWCYESLEARQAAREVVWQATQEQWQEIVARTVPLIR